MPKRGSDSEPRFSSHPIVCFLPGRFHNMHTSCQVYITTILGQTRQGSTGNAPVKRMEK